MTIKENVTTLFHLGISNYKIYKDTGIGQTTLSRYTTKKTDIGSMSLDNATTLNDYYNTIKGDIKMRAIMNTLKNNYKVNGEDQRYATMYANVDEIIEEFGDIERFEELHDIKANELHYPIITFDRSGESIDYKFGTDATREDILEVANDYFTSLDDDESVWEFETYNIYQETDLLRFENKDNEVIGYVTINEDENAIKELNNGADPILDGWEDGNGNEVKIEGWNLY